MRCTLCATHPPASIPFATRVCQWTLERQTATLVWKRTPKTEKPTCTSIGLEDQIQSDISSVSETKRRGVPSTKDLSCEGDSDQPGVYKMRGPKTCDKNACSLAFGTQLSGVSDKITHAPASRARSFMESTVKKLSTCCKAPNMQEEVARSNT
jgi:hypothetical protein